MVVHQKARRFLAQFYSALVQLLAALGLIVVLVTFTPFVQWAGRKLAGPWDDPRGDVLIVLAGSALGRRAPGESSYLRSVYASWMFREGGFRTVIISGDGGSPPEAEVMARVLEVAGVPSSAILIEGKAHSTRENAINTKPLLDHISGRRVLLTSDYHMFRAHRVFTKLGIDVSPAPIPDVLKRGSRWRGRWPAFLDLVQETAKIGYYYLRGWI